MGGKCALVRTNQLIQAQVKIRTSGLRAEGAKVVVNLIRITIKTK